MRRFVFWLFVIGMGVISYSAATIWQYGKHTDNVTTDTAIVLGAAVWGEAPSPVFRARIDHAITLYGEGLVGTLIFTGGAADGELAEAEVAKRYAIEKGVPESAIYIETMSTITEENLLYARAIMEEKSFQTATIISDPLHMKRAMLLAKQLHIAASSSPTPTTMYSSLSTKVPFLCREVFYYIGTVATPFRLR